jgi:diaminohydroxyphosphoribosylaminopyrimidine deaminase / 5-amino-6-(5-phosphoribosylamino)uracil reductase
MSQFSSFDHAMMARAIQLAKQGIYTTTPNPNVGCVITLGETVVGEGFHIRAGGPHAEVHALRMAGDKAVGSTAYVTLEPCSHYGRTPPCAEGLINAQVSRVVCAMQDPNPQVAGRGIALLKNAGIEVSVGLLEQESRLLNPSFIKRMSNGKPFVQLKMAASLDGQTALSNGKSQWITSPQARQDVQRYRAKAAAILSTSKTVIDDDASLAVRWEELPQSVQLTYLNGQRLLINPSVGDEAQRALLSSDLRQPTRVILDRQNRLLPSLRLYEMASPVLTVGPQRCDLIVSQTDGRLDLDTLFSKLVLEHNLHHIWVEAGPTLAGSLLAQRWVDEIIIYLAPKIMGSDGRGLFGALGLKEMEQVIDLDIIDITRVGPDIRITAKPNYKE